MAKARKKAKLAKLPKARRRPKVASEVQLPWRGRHNYVLNSQTVLRDVYRLLCAVLADGELAQVARDEHDVLVHLRDQFIEDELVHLLIATAVMNRSHDDHMMGPRQDKAELSFKPVTHACGTLLPDVDKDVAEEVELTFREACNKIIHADHITAETEQREDAAFPVLPQTVILRGTQGKKAWQAILNIPDYARATLVNFRDL
ncbi:hypothetical protein [Neoaquamicrobium sediminum]|uniref:Uncharacterized protein n=1 Tax=Neoaquamicrobium sediminum TaxID=1849104 RepID=A0ABV3WUA7_9HYPH